MLMKCDYIEEDCGICLYMSQYSTLIHGTDDENQNLSLMLRFLENSFEKTSTFGSDYVQ